MVRRPLLSVWLESTAEAQATGTQPQDLRRGCGVPAEPLQACVQLEGGLLQVSLHQQSSGLPVGRCPVKGSRAGHLFLGVSGEAPAHPTSSWPHSAPPSAPSTPPASSCAGAPLCQTMHAPSASSSP